MKAGWLTEAAVQAEAHLRSIPRDRLGPAARRLLESLDASDLPVGQEIWFDVGMVTTREESEARLQYLLDWIDDQGLLSEGCFTFPDGMTVWATGKGPEVTIRHHMSSVHEWRQFWMFGAPGAELRTWHTRLYPECELT